MEPIDACATADPHASLATSVRPWPLSPMPNPAWQADSPPINSTTIINLLMISTLSDVALQRLLRPGPSPDLTSQNVGNDQRLFPDTAASPARFQMSLMWAEQQSGARIGNYSERRACYLISNGRGHCTVNLICPVTWPRLAPA